MACYVFFRCWPGFTEDFPVERFNALSEAELPEALKRFAREQLRAQKAKIKAVRAERKQRLHEALLRQSRRVLRGGESTFAGQQLRAEKAETKTVPADPKERVCEALLRQLTVLPGSGGPGPGERLTRRELFAQHVRKAPHRSPLVCRVGGYLGWWGGGKCAFGDQVAGRRVWFWVTGEQDFAEYLVGRLNGRSLAEDFEVVEVEKVLSPRFGYVAAEGLGMEERTPIQRQINAIRDGKEPPVWHRTMALLLGQRARQFAEREAEAWVDSADPERRRKALATIGETAEEVLPLAVVDGGEGEEGSGAESTPAQPAIASGANREAVLRELQPAVRKAYLACQYAESKAGKGLEDREAHKLLEDEGIPTDKGDLGELADYELPAFDTWSRQVRAARQPLGEQKYTPRAGRSTGRSVVSGRRIEYQNPGNR